jgi:hypothetical protein
MVGGTVVWRGWTIERVTDKRVGARLIQNADPKAMHAASLDDEREAL